MTTPDASDLTDAMDLQLTAGEGGDAQSEYDIPGQGGSIVLMPGRAGAVQV